MTATTRPRIAPLTAMMAVVAMLLAVTTGPSGASTAAAPAASSADAGAAASARCNRRAIDDASRGRLIRKRCGGQFASGLALTRKNTRVRFLLKQRSLGTWVPVKGSRLAGLCSRDVVPDRVRSVSPCGSTAVPADPCAAFPADEVPPDPNNPHPPYGDPQQPDSLDALRAAVLGAAVSDDYSKNSVLCAEHPDDIPADQCDVAYWNPSTFSGSGQLPGRAEDCNFFYLRVGNEYWTGLTPMILNQYGEYLGVTADGHDAANQHAGPHTTIASYSPATAFLQGKGQYSTAFSTTGGSMAPGDVSRAMESVLDGQVVGSGMISPILFGDALQVDCTPAWQNTGGNWTSVAVKDLAVRTGTTFSCAATAPGAGTAFVKAVLGNAAGGSVPAAISITVMSSPSNTLRQDPTKGFTDTNVVWPNGLREVRDSEAIPFTLDTAPTCGKDGQPQVKESCLHLWVNPNNGGGCKIWFTLELQSRQLLSIMSSYGLGAKSLLRRSQAKQFGDDDAGYTPHISLAKRNVKASEVPPPWGTAPVGTRDVCTDANNLANGKPGVSPFVPTP